ncbi:transcription-repair coupling factor [Neisseria bacilliformis ATCC BAA-1200]|uniref:Transcription-repair-coupling factor n=1 Tax=Neisseria bacilliformis ATCC BAA-1200 TaxID=888742 RepID=F2BET4_9NEIS|nr:transcription-repair coupling factor [Neisseria bacilliformis]EGF09989.1 transcription-repair coupling factor [Neisseria bacilliformis ATCC BAA-1200]QMT46891.1 transcription-repair coupling factor [Neisseria bacilliformis]
MTLPLPTKSAPRVRWLNLTAGSLPYFLTQNLPAKPPKLILTPDAETALRLQTAWQFFRPEDNALFLPDWETLPYERFSPHQDLVSERLSVLWQLKNGLAHALFVPVSTAMQRLAPAPFLLGRTFWLKTGQRLDIAALRQNLVEAGYSAVSNVVAGGEFAVRGGIVDLFPTGSDTPYRIDLFDDEIDSIKTFDPDSQRTIAPVSEIRLLPAHEFPTDDAAQKIFRSRFREEVNGNPNDAAVYKAVSGGQFGAGVEYYLPLFFEDGCATLFDYLGADALAVCVGDVHTEARRFEAEVKSRFQMAQGDATYPPLPPQHLYLAADQFSGCLKGYPQILPELGGAAFALPNVAVNRQAEQPLQALQDFQTAFDGRILLTAESAGRRETMLGFFAQHGLKPKSVDGWQAFLESCEKLCITVTPLAYGFKLGQPENGVGRILESDTSAAADVLSDTSIRPTDVSDGIEGSLKAQARPRYTDGTPMHIGDYVRVEQAWHGRIVALFDLNEYGDESLAGLANGIMVKFDEAGLVHYENEQLADELTFIARADRQPENSVGRILESDTPAASDVLSDTGIRSMGVSDDLSGSLKIALITESDLYQYVAKSRSSTRRKKHAAVSDGLLRDLAEISIGDPVVHEEHGIGRYMGLVSMDLGGEAQEMMLLEYAGEAQLYVPVSQLHLISRYSGAAHENVQLHKLGSAAWNKAKRKAAEKARDTAAELLNLYARRAAQEGHKFQFDEDDYRAFADGFGYEETEDQAAAIAAVIKDLTQARPMDRLVCGDVGFGKTEVALRAAFVAVMGGKQVAVLAPTTLLVEQHAQNFADRFADFPVKVAQLSRFNSSKETRATLTGMADGTVDIVIGTHKLVQDDISFKNLGLVIIDEEHRFGVRQKEQLKKLRANVDILTLTATPIPRTLSMALEGLRDFSLITTAPSRRLAVKTFVKPFSEGSVREAVLRELKRGGQVFFLHNEVDTIENMRERLETLLPEARIGVAHGQLRERELEQVMRDFLQQRFNVLLCSTIIETGIDIPNANTIIINRADKFGIAQLHQLRGRVGRSHHQAYAYLLTPEYISKDAEKRLDAIAAADELGAGFSLAMQDLEIRGAGEILGEGQSGEMVQVGFTLYTEMLKQAVRDLKKGRQPDLDAPLGVTTEIKLHSPALLPESYCPDIHERLVLYKRLATCESEGQINSIHEELVDRFGLPEQPVTTLLESHRLRLMAKSLGITTIDASSDALTLTFGKHTSVEPADIILLMQSNKNYRMAGADRLRVTAMMESVAERVRMVRAVMKQLSPKAA